jgi:pimeloyl-ACP methyl ester carboxylesterase
MSDDAYKPLKLPQTARHDIRGASYMVRSWGDASAPPLVLLHGTRDASASFQFLVDSLKGNWRIIAPDWRGHGQTQNTVVGSWFHDYLADLDALLEALFPNQPVDLVGHSLGGNVASVYAGLRPDKVRHMISLDAFGVVPLNEAQVRDEVLNWLQSARRTPPHKRYHSVAEMAHKLCASNRRLSWDKALYLAANMSRPLAGGGFTWQFELVLRRSTQTLHTLGEWIACWQKIMAPKLWIASADGLPGTVRADPKLFAEVKSIIDPGSVQVLADTGHNLHHDAPVLLAAMIERFLYG